MSTMGDEFIDAIDAKKLRSEIKRLEYEKPRLVQWTSYDEERLCAYREIEFLRSKVVAMRNRIEDDRKTINRLCEIKGFFTEARTS